MGAEMIGYILVGPVKLKVQKTLVANAQALVAAAKKAVTDPETGEADPGSGNYYEESLTPQGAQAGRGLRGRRPGSDGGAGSRPGAPGLR